MADSVRPVIVAGGLTADSVGTVIKELQPFAVDVSSGVESGPGTKDRGAMREFFAAVDEADRSLVP
jgi:phosphoribosylanthranilate isomerase